MQAAVKKNYNTINETAGERVTLLRFGSWEIEYIRIMSVADTQIKLQY